MTKILYRGPLYRVIHSTEEEAECLADGWLPTPEDGKRYVVHTVIQAPTSCFAPSIEEEKREVAIVPPISASEYHALNHDTLPGAPAAGFCPEPEQSSYVIPDDYVGSDTPELEALRSTVAARKTARKAVRIVKPNGAEVKALG